MKCFTALVVLFILVMGFSYEGHGTEHIVTKDGTCYGRNHYELLWIHDPIVNPFVLEVCKP